VLRIFNVIGPRETNPHVLPHLFESLRGSDTVMLGNLDARRDYIHARDVARAILVVAARSHGLAVYNVGSGRSHSVVEIVELLRRKLARPVNVEVDPLRLRPSDRPLLLADIEKISMKLGWTPQIALEEALDELILYYDLRTVPEPGLGA
jgi:UDP-glucose 4-epimerase